MSLGKWIAAGTGVVCLLLIVLSMVGVGAAIPLWVVLALILAVCTAVVVG